MIDNCYFKLNDCTLNTNKLNYKGKRFNFTYGIYYEYNYGNLILKHFINGTLTISGSLRKYYYSKNSKNDYWKNNLTLNEVKDIGNDLKAIGIDLSKLELISYEYGFTIKHQNIIKNIECTKYSMSNYYGKNGYKAISKRKDSKRIGISKNKLFRIYIPDIKEEFVKTSEQSQYIRFEQYIPKGTKKLLKLKSRFTYQDLCNAQPYKKFHSLFKDKMKSIIFIDDSKLKPSNSMKSNKLLDNALSLKRNRILAGELVESKNDKNLNAYLNAFNNNQNDKNICHNLIVEFDKIYNNFN